MLSQQTLLKILADGKYHSGSELGDQLGVSRAAVWKVIQKLQQYYSLNVFAVRGKGYRLHQPLELLNKDNIQQALSKSTLKQIKQFEIFFDIDSTNQYLNTKNLDAAAAPYIVLAEQQSNGQGRRGRSWIAPFASNLILSLLWRFQFGPAQLGCLSLFIAVAIVRALKKSGINGAGVKWPNDIYWQNKKLAGILLEMRGEFSGPSAVVIGVGLNINMQANNKITNGIDQPWVDLETISGKKINRNNFTATAIDALFEVLNEISDEKNTLLDEWQKMDILKDKEIEVNYDNRVIHGKALGINKEGSLRVEYKGKEIVCHSGDVRIRPRQNDT